MPDESGEHPAQRVMRVIADRAALKAHIDEAAETDEIVVLVFTPGQLGDFSMYVASDEGGIAVGRLHLLASAFQRRMIDQAMDLTYDSGIIVLEGDDEDDDGDIDVSTDGCGV